MCVYLEIQLQLYCAQKLLIRKQASKLFSLAMGINLFHVDSHYCGDDYRLQILNFNI